MKKKYLFLVIVVALIFGMAWSSPTEKPEEFIFGDLLPDAPVLAKRGDYKVGVRTVSLVNKNQLDILNYKDSVASTYDRPITVEVWYPAIVSSAEEEIEVYDEVLGNFGDPKRPLIPFEFKGRCKREAKVNGSDGPYPLLILSHGYTGSRYIFTYLAENLASKGYVVVSIDHTESTFRDAANFSSTLLNRSLDQLFVLNEMDRLSQPESGNFLSGLVDANNTGLVGFSMGGYGVLNTAGAGYSKNAAFMFSQMSGGCDALNSRMAGNEDYINSQDERIKAVVAFAPWGMTIGAWDSTGLAGLTKPVFFVAGSEDDISGYEKGTKAIFEGVVNSNRYLLTYMNARHNVAPNPPPAEALEEGMHIDEYLRYADSVWDQKRINNINQHFVSAFLGIHLKGKDYQKFLQIDENSKKKILNGFKPRTFVGLQLDHLTKKD